MIARLNSLPSADEAVVLELLRRCGGAVELVDVSDRLPGLSRAPGLHTWRVFDGTMREFTTFDEASKVSRLRTEQNRARRNAGKIPDTVFPPPPEEAASLHLERCMRLLPHAQDTGGFFVALLRKRAALPPWARLTKPRLAFDAAVAAEAAAKAARTAVAASEAAAGGADAPAEAAVADPSAGPEGVQAGDAEDDDEAADAEGGAAAAGALAAADGGAADGGAGDDAEAGEAAATIDAAALAVSGGEPPLPAGSKRPREADAKADAKADSFLFRAVDDACAAVLRESYGLQPSFPAHLIITRSELSKSMSMIAEVVKRHVLPGSSEAPRQGRLRLVNTGMKVFDWNSGTIGDAHQTYRLLQVWGGAASPFCRPCHFTPAPLFSFVLQEGIHLIYPHMTRRVALVSGRELQQILARKGQQVIGREAYSPRLAALIDRFSTGSYVVVLTPALDAHDGDEADLYPAASGLSEALEISADGLTVTPRPSIPIAAAAFLPPALRPHYVPDAAAPETTLRFMPSPRTTSTADPQGRLVLCMWRGVGRHSIMVPAKDVAWLESLFYAQPAYAHLAPQKPAAGQAPVVSEVALPAPLAPAPAGSGMPVDHVDVPVGAAHS